MINNNFIVGGDPEFFCIDNSTNRYISMVSFLKGTKKKPNSIGIKGCFDLIDNVGIEFNMPPAPDYWILYELIEDCIKYTNSWLKEIDPNFSLKITSSAYFDKQQLKSKEAMLFGCEPAYSIYNWKSDIPRPEPETLNGLRTASYHIHYGWNEEIDTDILRYFMLLNDIFLGFPALYIDKTDIERKKVYGALSEHRIKNKKQDYYEIRKSNRIEYRTLGAGIHNYPSFVDNGIALIRKNCENLEKFIKLYYDDFVELNKNIEDEYIKENIKNKLIANGHYNQ